LGKVPDTGWTRFCSIPCWRCLSRLGVFN